MFTLSEIAIICGVLFVVSRVCACRTQRHAPVAMAVHGCGPRLNWRCDWQRGPGPQHGGPGGGRHHGPGGPPRLLWIVLIVAAIWYGRGLLPSFAALPSWRTLVAVGAVAALFSLMRGRRRGGGKLGFIALLAVVVATATIWGWNDAPRVGLHLDPDLELEELDRLGERIEERVERSMERVRENLNRHHDRLQRRHGRARGGDPSRNGWDVTLDIDLFGDALAKHEVDAAQVAAAVMQALRVAAAAPQPEAIELGPLLKVTVAERDGRAVALEEVARVTKKQKRSRQDDAAGETLLTVQMSLDGKAAVDMNEVALELERRESEVPPSQRALIDLEADEEDLDFEVVLARLRTGENVAAAAATQPAETPQLEAVVVAAPVEPAVAPEPPVAPAAPTPAAPAELTPSAAPAAAPSPMDPSSTVAAAPPAPEPKSLPKYPIERSERPEWLDKKPVSADGLYYVVASDGPYSEPECDREKVRLARTMAADYFETYANQPLEAARIPWEALVRGGVIREYYKEPLQTSFGPMYQVHELLAFDDRSRGMLSELRRQALVEERLVKVGAGGGLLAALLGTLLGYLKLDTATRGYYTKRLTLAAGAVAAGAAALAALVWQGQLGF